MFQIFEIYPLYDNRDAVRGMGARVHPYNFLTEAGAFAVKALLARRDWNDEVTYVVRPVGQSPFSPSILDFAKPVLADGDDLPF